LNQNTTYIKANKEKDRTKESLEIASSKLFKIFTNKFEKFVKNAYKNKD